MLIFLVLVGGTIWQVKKGIDEKQEPQKIGTYSRYFLNWGQKLSDQKYPKVTVWVGEKCVFDLK